MNHEQHARILRAYLSEIGRERIEICLNAIEDVGVANMQYGLNAQVEANTRSINDSLAAIESIPQYYLRNLDIAIKEAAK